GVDESTIWTHLGIFLYRFCVLKCLFCANNRYKTLDFQVFGLRNKARTLICKKEQSELKEQRNEVCQALKDKINSARERNSRRVAKRFRDAVLDRPKLQNLRILKAKAKRRWN
ncbi:hypothetical protein MTR67_025968, partial [Solanum verrucosum]